MEVIAQDNEQYFGRAGVDAMYGAIDGDSEEYDPEGGCHGILWIMSSPAVMFGAYSLVALAWNL